MKTLKNCLIILVLVVSFSLTSAFAGTLSTCDPNRTDGGTAGYESSGETCFSGGGQSFCAGGAAFNYTYECAGATFSANDAETDWLAFDPPASLNEDQQYNYLKATTRDANRGRAGKDLPLFINQFGICRAIDNSSATTSLPSMFLPLKSEEEWRNTHGVGPGDDPTSGGYSHVSNKPNLPPIFTCCAPQLIEICGAYATTGYARLGDTVQMAVNGGYAEAKCVGNNQFNIMTTTGICGGFDGSGSSSDPVGYHNPSTGGHISASDYPAGGVPGYSEVGQNVSTDKQGKADLDAAQAQAEQDVADAEAAAEAAKAAEEAAKAAAEAAAAEAEAEANDNDDNDN